MDASPSSAPSRTYRLVRWVARTMLRSQYRRIEVEDPHLVPPEGPVLLVANHGSALADPMALLVLSPRPTSFLAKAPLWKSPLLRPVLEALGAVPVFRPQDAEENDGRGARANLETFAACRDRLERGACLAIFPEGASHAAPRLLPVRTGAARIALATNATLKIVPAGLVYDHPTRDGRGTLLVRFGAPFPVTGGGPGGPRRAAIASVTRAIEASLKLLLAEADSQADLRALRVLRTVYDQERGQPPPRTLAEEHRRHRRFARWLAEWTETAPREVQELRAATDAYVRSLELAGVRADLLDTPYTAARVGRFIFRELPAALIVGPLAFAAGILTWPIRKVGDLIALRAFGGAEDVRALCRMIGIGLVLVLAMGLCAIAGGILLGPWGVAAALVGLPAALALHVFWSDRASDARARVRAFLLLAGGKLRPALLRQRRALFERLLAAPQDPVPPAPKGAGRPA